MGSELPLSLAEWALISASWIGNLRALGSQIFSRTSALCGRWIKKAKLRKALRSSLATPIRRNKAQRDEALLKRDTYVHRSLNPSQYRF